MSSVTVEPAKKSQSRSKAKEKRQGQTKASGTDRLKTVVRRLPPNLPEPIFWQSVQTWVTDDTVLWKEFWPGKVKKKLNKENVHSRAYIAFKTEESVAKFSREYDGHIFKDRSGNESQAVVEFAPYQKLPLEKKKTDGRNATIEQDEEYIAFLQSLEAPSTKPHDADQLLEMLVASTERPAMPASTPLLDALKAEKSAQRDKEAIQRNHPHYKDAVQASKREEFKKKAAATSSAAAESKKSGESTAPLGKRAAKRAAAAAAQKASAHAGPAAQPKSGNAPSEAKPPSSSPSKGKFARAGKHHPKPPSSTAPSQVAPVSAATAPSSPPPTEVSAQVTTPAPAAPTAPALTPASSDNPGRRTRPVLGIASRHFEAALSGAGVSKGSGGSRRERAAEREREKESTKDDSSREKRDGGGRRRKEDDALQRSGSGNTPAGPQPGVLPALQILQREPKNTPPRPSNQAPSADPSSGTAATPDSTNHPTAPHRGSGKRGRARGRGRGGDRGAPPPPPPSAVVDS